MARRAAAQIGQFTLWRDREGWWAVWYIKEDGRNRRKRRTIGIDRNAPRGVAVGAFAKWVRAFEAARGQDAPYTIGEIVTRYIDDRRREGKQADKLECQWHALAPHFENMQPPDLEQPIEVEGQQRTRCHAYAVARDAAGRARDTIHSELSMLRTAMHWGVKRQLCKPVHVWVSSPGRPRETALTEDQVVSLLRAIMEATRHIRLLMLIAWATGARREAILDLTWDRIDFEKGVIDFRTKTEKHILDTSHQKGRAVVAIGEWLARELRDAKRIAQTVYVIEYRRRRVTDPSQGVRDVFKAAGIEGRYFGVHALRRTLATAASEHGIDLKIIQEQLGHADSRTTEGVYIQHRANRLRGVAAMSDQQMARVIEGEKKSPD